MAWTTIGANFIQDAGTTAPADLPFTNQKVKVRKITTTGAIVLEDGNNKAFWSPTGAGELDFGEGQWFTGLHIQTNAGLDTVTVFFA